MNKYFGSLLLVATVGWTVAGQNASPTPVAPSPKMSAVLSKRLQTYDASAAISRQEREQAYASLMQAQRYIWEAGRLRSPTAMASAVRSARSELQKALEHDPGVSEAYTLLAESWVNPNVPPNDVEESIALASLAVRLNKDNFGAHRLLARLYTFKSHLNNGNLDPDFAGKAVAEWKEVARLDPRNAEAWAFLAAFYEQGGKQNERIEALQKWQASAPPLDRQFYQSTMRGQEDLSPETASKKLGSALVKAGRMKEAVEVLGQVIADNADESEAVDELREALDNADAKTSSTAIESLQQATYSNPSNLALLGLLAQAEAKAHGVDEAVRTLVAARDRKGPNEHAAVASIDVMIGDLYAEHERLSDSATAYEKALADRGFDTAQSLSSDEREFAMALFEKLITVYKRADRIDDAKAAIVRARKLLGRDDLFADRQLISLYQDTGDKTNALASVQALRQKNPDDISLLRLEATLLGEMGQVDKGVELIKKRIADAGASTTKSLRLDDDLSNYLFISQLYSDAGLNGEAITAAQTALSVASGSQQQQIAKMMLASAQQGAGKFAEAESTLRDILKQTPGNPIALNNLGYFLLERGERFAEALDMIQRAVKTDPTNPSFLDSLGWAYFRLEKLDDAEKYLKQAASLDLSSGTIQEHLGDVYQKQGKTEQARVAWRRAQQLTSRPADVTRIKEKLAALK